MARYNAVAKGGFYPMPLHLAATVGAMLRPDWRQGAECRLVDPCAGEGAALACLKTWIGREPVYRGDHRVDTYACEMEPARWEILRQTDPKRQAPCDPPQHLLGDFFQVKCDVGMADVLFLNPPYDVGRDGRRLEARFLEVASPMVIQGGVLVFVVPYYVLGACAAALALHYTDLQLFRFPGADFDAFRQVVVFGRRVVRTVADPDVAAWAVTMGESVEGAPELPAMPEHLLDAAGSYAAEEFVEAHGRYRAPTRWNSTGGYRTLARWSLVGFDVAGVAEIDPWANDRGPIAGLALPADLSASVNAVFPVLSPVGAVHLASAVAAGAFMGVEVEPNGPSAPGRRRPGLLIKGTFGRDWATANVNHDREGHVTSIEQVERPHLEVWVLDLEEGGYHLLENSQDVHDELDGIAGATFADLVTHYSRGLLAALRRSCPVLHERGRDEEPPIPGLAAPLWRAQHSTVWAAHKAADPDTGRGVLFMAEPGSGKTRMTAALLALRGVRRALVQVPPHLLSTWRRELAEVRPDVQVMVIESVADVREAARYPGPLVALLSREASKLGHAVEAVGAQAAERRLPVGCPRCGAALPEGKVAEKRLRCGSLVLRPTPASAPLAAWLRRHLHLLLQWQPDHPGLASLLPPTPMARRWLAWVRSRPRPASPEVEQRVVEAAFELVGVVVGYHGAALQVLHRLAWALPSAALGIVERLPAWAPVDLNERYNSDAPAFVLRERVGLTLPPSVPFTLGPHPNQARLDKSLVAAWQPWMEARAYIHAKPGEWTGKAIPGGMYGHDGFGEGHKGCGAGFDRGALLGNTRGSRGAAHVALNEIVTWADLQPRPARAPIAVEHKPAPVVCGEPLYQAVPRPRRVALGSHIATHAKGVFDAYVMDEAQELASETSAQGIVSARLARAAHRDRALLVYLSGSIDNGYADSLFHALWAVSPDFRARFKPSDRERFAEEYGLRRRVVTYSSKAAKGSTQPVVRGAHSERVLDGTTRMAGFAPGVLPTGVLKHVLACAVVLHKADLDINLPPLTQEGIAVPMLSAQREHLDAMRKLLTRAIGLLSFKAGCRGKLFGALTRLVHYPDLAAVGNTLGGDAYELRCPESMPEVSVGELRVGPGAVLMRVPTLPREDLLPKEARMLALVRQELAEGRGCLVLPVSADLLQRYAWILDQAGINAALLVADKVAPAKRDAWIASKLGQDKRRVLISNPDAVRTGLNSLAEHLCTAICMQNPDCKPITDRQVIDRLHRPKQTQPVRALRLVYDHALPQLAQRLLMHKIGVSLGVDGLDPEAVYAAAGIGDQITAGLSVGHQLYRMLCEQADLGGAE